MSEAPPEAGHEAELVTELQCDHVLPQGGGDLPQALGHLLTGHRVRELESIIRHRSGVNTNPDVRKRLQTNAAGSRTLELFYPLL